MRRREFSDAERNELLREHLRTLADWHDAGDDSQRADFMRAKAQAAQDAYLRARELLPANS